MTPPKVVIHRTSMRRLDRYAWSWDVHYGLQGIGGWARTRAGARWAARRCIRRGGQVR